MTLQDSSTKLKTCRQTGGWRPSWHLSLNSEKPPPVRLDREPRHPEQAVHLLEQATQLTCVDSARRATRVRMTVKYQNTPTLTGTLRRGRSVEQKVLGMLASTRPQLIPRSHPLRSARNC